MPACLPSFDRNEPKFVFVEEAEVSAVRCPYRIDVSKSSCDVAQYRMPVVAAQIAEEIAHSHRFLAAPGGNQVVGPLCKRRRTLPGSRPENVSFVGGNITDAPFYVCGHGRLPRLLNDGGL